MDRFITGIDSALNAQSVESLTRALRILRGEPVIRPIDPTPPFGIGKVRLAVPNPAPEFDPLAEEVRAAANSLAAQERFCAPWNPLDVVPIGRKAGR